MDQQKIAENYRIKILAQTAELMQLIGTKDAFVRYYYKVLPRCKSQKQVYVLVSVMYELIYKEELFKTYSAFRMYKKRNLK